LRRLAAIAAARPERLAVAVLSGRAAGDVAARVRVGGLTYVGNHGLESGWLARGARADRLVVTPDGSVREVAGEAAALLADVAARLGQPDWLFLEDKGPSIAFHYRQAPDHRIARAAVRRAVADARADGLGASLETIDGRRVVELRPAGAGGKGGAVERLLAGGAGTALVMGDDRSDAEAFGALLEAREAGQVEGRAVAVHGATETPAEVVELADLILDAPVDAARFLARLADRLEGETGAR
jgi:trehalose-phosphatase